ncbi:MAG: hypothetical protein AB1805_10340 [Nitrospirota bacterium]
MGHIILSQESKAMVSQSTYRQLTIRERDIIERLLEVDFQGRCEIREQLNHCLAKQIDQDGSLKFNIKADVKANVKRRIPVEAEIEDEDGTIIHILLHVVDGKLDELEFYKEDGSPIIKVPDPSKLRLLLLD